MAPPNRTWQSDAEWGREIHRKISACRQLLAAADSLHDRRMPTVDEKRQTIFEEFARATKTFRATLVLAEAGYGQQAQVLARSLFESAMVMRWAVKHLDIADELSDLHARFALDLYLQARRERGYTQDGPYQAQVTAAERARAQQLFGRYGTGYWTGHRRLEDLVDAVVAEADDPEWAKDHWGRTFEIHVAWANRMTHTTGLSNRAYRAEGPHEEEDEETGVIITGPSRHQVSDALLTASNSYMWFLEAFVEEVGPPELRARLAGISGLVWRAWKRPEQLRGLADDDPCPCDQPGTLWAQCHKWTEVLEPSPGMRPPPSMSVMREPRPRKPKRKRRRR